MPQAVSRPFDPARDAARLLGWFGLAILMVGAPVVSVLSRQALFTVLPIGGAVLAAGVLFSISRGGFASLRQTLVSTIGLASLGLLGWTALSLIWTPFPEFAAPRLLATVVTVAIAALVIAHLPDRGVQPNLVLLPIGLVLGAAALIAASLFGPPWFHGGSEYDPSLVERSAVSLTLLVWPALGALGILERWRSAMLLAIVIATALVAAQARLALATFAFAALSFAFAAPRPSQTARRAAAFFAGLVVVAPLLPFGLALLLSIVPGVGQSTIASLVDWRMLIESEPLRLITGHGLDTAHAGVMFGFLPAHTPRSILFEVWFDLGIIGAVALAAAFGLGLQAAGRAAATVAPALIGGLVATLLIAIFGIATTELWFVTLVAVQAVAFGLLARTSGFDRPVRLPAEPVLFNEGDMPFGHSV